MQINGKTVQEGRSGEAEAALSELSSYARLGVAVAVSRCHQHTDDTMDSLTIEHHRYNLLCSDKFNRSG